MERTGLVLEGGGMRGVYTAGVLEYFLEEDLILPYVIGVSAGACNAASYLSRQKGRNKKVNIEYAGRPEYISYRNLVRKKELFGMDFIFNEIPNKLEPYDYDTFYSGKEEFVIGTTDCETGESVFFGRDEYGRDVLTALRASSSLPYMAPIINFKGKKLLDGGISDPIPIKKSEQSGNMKNIVILTRNADYRKKKAAIPWFLKRPYRQYPNLVGAMENRYSVYNDTLDYIQSQEKAGKTFIIRPSVPLEVGRVERSGAKLTKLYHQGYEDAKKHYEALLSWMGCQPG